jgi:protein O-mannosyl-transferase
MSSRTRTHFLLLLLVLVAAFGLYWPGLSGSFVFDDYGALVFNQGVHITSLSFEELRRGAWSYAVVGPLGRPLAMLTFALDHVFHGLDPFYYKLENVLIHLVNGYLMWLFTRHVCRLILMSGPARKLDTLDGLALFVVAVWVLGPLSMTSVLYVVQRMTSLSATFTLLGLLGYLHFRALGVVSRRGGHFISALGILGAFTALSIYTKESGVLTVGYAWLLEWVVIRALAPKTTLETSWALVWQGIPLLLALYVVYFLVSHPGWLVQEVPSRNFNSLERFQTELRVLVFYLRQIVFPQSHLFGLYHDDFVISRGWLDPVTTLWAAIFHATLIAVAVVRVRSWPVFALGVTWFYMGHLLESSVFLLELVHEHRNYLAMWGMLFALSYGLHTALNSFPKIRLLAALIVLAAVSSVTLNRAHMMGDGVFYPLHEARLHPESARATYDSASTLIGVVRREPSRLAELAPQIHQYLQASQNADKDALAPLLGKVTIAAMEERKDPEDLTEFERRLRYGVPPNAIYMIVISLMELAEMDSPSFTFDHLEPLLQAAIDNPKLQGTSRTAILANLAMLRASIRGDKEGAKRLLIEALDVSPGASQVRLNYANLLASDKQYDEARHQVRLARASDAFGYNRKLADEIEKWIEEHSQSADHVIDNNSGKK